MGLGKSVENNLVKKFEVIRCVWYGWFDIKCLASYGRQDGKSSVIRRQGEPQNGCYEKTKLAKFSEKRTFLTNWYAHMCVSVGQKYSLTVPCINWNDCLKFHRPSSLQDNICIYFHIKGRKNWKYPLYWIWPSLLKS